MSTSDKTLNLGLPIALPTDKVDWYDMNKGFKLLDEAYGRIDTGDTGISQKVDALETAMAGVKSDITAANAAASAASAKATAADQKATTAQTAAQSANVTATNAASTANEAKTAAARAQTTANQKWSFEGSTGAYTNPFTAASGIENFQIYTKFTTGNVYIANLRFEISGNAPIITLKDTASEKAFLVKIASIKPTQQNLPLFYTSSNINGITDYGFIIHSWTDSIYDKTTQQNKLSFMFITLGTYQNKPGLYFLMRGQEFAIGNYSDYVVPLFLFRNS